MSQIEETVTKAAQTIDLVSQAISEAMNQAASVMRPEGLSLADKVSPGYLADCLELAKQLQAKLERIA